MAAGKRAGKNRLPLGSRHVVFFYCRVSFLKCYRMETLMLSRVLPLTIITLLLIISPALSLAADAAFQRTWERTDKPVFDGQAARTWMWGPESFTGTVTEEYAESPGGTRDVQYFDKSRMEVTNPDAVDDGVWYVTNGLLVVELISGNIQTGHDSFETRSPAGVPVAGDSDDVDGPTYATFVALLEVEPVALRQAMTERVDRNGRVTQDKALGALGITAVHIDNVTNHAVAEPFWEFMNSTGVVWEDGGLAEATLFQDSLFATGRPITEAYWATVKVANTAKDVLIQCFERRCLTFTPDNPEGWQVEAGNVGRHYYSWRYNQTEPEPSPTPTPTPGMGLVSVSSIQGIETSAGSVDGDTRYGTTFIGTSSGDVPGTFRAKINYTPPKPGSGVTNTVVGGEWSITSDKGTVNGTFQGGSAQWDEAGDYATINVIMKVIARTGDFEGLPREARFDGTLSHTVFPPRIAGVLTIYP